MPQINVTGKKVPYSADTRREADYWNSNHDSKRNHTWQEAQQERQQRDAENKAKERAANASAKRGFDLMESYGKRLQRDNLDRIKSEEKATAESARRGYHAFEAVASLRQREYNDRRRTEQRDQATDLRYTIGNEDAKYRHKQRLERAAQATVRRDQQADFRWTKQNENAKWAYQQRKRRQDAVEAARVQRDADRDARRASLEASRATARSNPETYVQGGIGGLGNRGYSASLGGSRAEARDAMRRLGRIERRTRAQMSGASGARHSELTARLTKIGEARAQIAGGSELAGMGEGAMGMAGGALGMAAAAAVGLLKAGKAVYGAPGWLAEQAAALQGAAAPFTDFKYAGADLGRANNIAGQDIRDQFYKTGERPPEWMSAYGLSATEAMRVAGSTGLPYGSAESLRNTVEDLAGADRMRGLAGLGTERLGASLNKAQTLGLQYQDPLSGAPTQLMDSEHGGRNAYFKLLSEATTKGTMLGLDRSQTLGNLEGLFRQAGSGGAIRPNGSALADMYVGMAEQGSARSRSGEAQASVQAGLQDAISGLGVGGDSMQYSILQSRIKQMGGIPKSRDALAKFFHMTPQELAAFESTPAGKDAVGRMISSDSAYAFGEYAKPLILSNKDRYSQLITESDAYRTTPESMRPIVFGRLAHTTTQDGADYTAGRRTTAGRYNKDDAKSDLQFFMSRGWSRNRSLGILGNLEQESGGKINPTPGDGGTSFGLMQLHSEDRKQNFFNRYHHDISQGTRDEQRDFIDWELKNTEKKAGDALQAGPDDERSAADTVNRLYERSRDRTSNRADSATRLKGETADVADNDTSKEDRTRVNTGQLQLQEAEKNNTVANATAGGELGGQMIELSGAVVGAVNRLGDFSGALDGVVSKLRQIVDGTFNGGGHPMPAPIAPKDNPFLMMGP